MLWLFLSLISAFFLGLYDVFKKIALKDNAVFPTLMVVTTSGAILMLPFVLLSVYNPDYMMPTNFYVPSITGKEHLLIFLKSLLVTSSWIFAYLALRNLPITIVSPIRATGPLWTLMGAIILFGEHLNGWQWLGVVITLGFFYSFTLAGRAEGIHFEKNVWIWCIIVATLLSASSSLYDKYLLSTLSMNKMAVQAWFTIYQVPIMIPMVLFYWRPRRLKYPFTFKWSAPFIALFLLIADYAYFYALSIPESLVSIVSPIRRAGVIIAFLFGAFMFKEQNISKKAYLLLGILAGIFIIMYASR